MPVKDIGQCLVSKISDQANKYSFQIYKEKEGNMLFDFTVMGKWNLTPTLSVLERLKQEGHHEFN